MIDIEIVRAGNKVTRKLQTHHFYMSKMRPRTHTELSRDKCYKLRNCL